MAAEKTERAQTYASTVRIVSTSKGGQNSKWMEILENSVWF